MTEITANHRAAEDTETHGGVTLSDACRIAAFERGARDHAFDGRRGRPIERSA